MSPFRTSLACICLFMALQLSPCIALSHLHPGQVPCASLPEHAHRSTAEMRAGMLVRRLQHTCATTARLLAWRPGVKHGLTAINDRVRPARSPESLAG